MYIHTCMYIYMYIHVQYIYIYTHVHIQYTPESCTLKDSVVSNDERLAPSRIIDTPTVQWAICVMHITLRMYDTCKRVCILFLYWCTHVQWVIRVMPIPLHLYNTHKLVCIWCLYWCMHDGKQHPQHTYSTVSALHHIFNRWCIRACVLYVS